MVLATHDRHRIFAKNTGRDDHYQGGIQYGVRRSLDAKTFPALYDGGTSLSTREGVGMSAQGRAGRTIQLQEQEAI